MSIRPCAETLDNYDFLLEGTDSAADNDDVASLVTAINNYGKACRVALDGFVGVNSQHTITNPYGVELFPRRPGSGFAVKGPLGGFNVGNFSWYPQTSGTAMTATAAFAGTFTTPISLNVGDWFAVCADDALSPVLLDVSASGGYDYHCPAEIHQVRDVIGGVVYFDDFFVDPLTANPKIGKVPMLARFWVHGLSFKYDDVVTSPPTNNFFYARCVADVRVEDNQWLGGYAPSGVYGNLLGSFQVKDNIWSRLSNDYTDPGYCVVAGTINRGIITGNTAKGHRHFFTTDPLAVLSRKNYGTTRNTIVANNSCSTNGHHNTAVFAASTMATFDLHCNGWGVVLSGNQVSMPSEDGFNNQAFKIRGRHVHCKNNVIDGGGSAIGFDLYSGETELTGNHISRCVWGVVIGRGYGSAMQIGNALLNAVPVDNRVKDNRFVNCTIPIHVQRGADTHVLHNSFEDCAYNTANVLFGAYSSYTASPSGSNNRVIGNDIPKGFATFSVDCGSLAASQIVIAGNACDGYGTLSGWTGSSAASTLTLTAHGFYDGMQVRVSSSGTLPGGLVAATDYYVVNSTATTIKLSATLGGSPITLTTNGTGTIVVYATSAFAGVNAPTGGTSITTSANAKNWT